MHKKIALPLAVVLVLLITLSVGIPVSAAERIYQYDFEEDSTSDTFEDLLMYDFFDYKLPANTNSTATIQEEGDNQFLALEGYVSIRSWDEMQDYPYTFSLDIRQSVFNNIGFFVRGITPGEMTVINPRNANKEQDFDYFEVDWYTQNGGKNGTTTIGGSGIFVFPQENAFRVGVKVYREDGLTISSEYYDFPRRKVSLTIIFIIWNSRIRHRGFYLGKRSAAFQDCSERSGETIRYGQYYFVLVF